MNRPLFIPLAAVLVLASPRAQDPVEPAPTAPAKLKVDRVDLEGSYADLPEQGFDLTALLAGGGKPPKDFYAMRAKLEELAKGRADSPVLLDLAQPVDLNGAQLAELARTIAKIRASGRRTYAYLENGGPVHLQLAAMCDEVLMAEMGVLDVAAPSLSVSFLKDLFDLLGVRFDVVRCGDFKGAVEPYVLPRMSDHLREHYLQMVARMNRELVERVATGRNLTADKVRALQAQRVVLAHEAKAAGLVDRLVPWVGANAALQAALGRDDVEFHAVLAPAKKRQSFNPMAILAELFAPKKDKEIEEPSIAVVHLNGGIVDGKEAQPGSMVSGATVKLIRQVADDANIKAVVLRVNSPGGSATASEAIRVALTDLAAKKPVVFSMGRVAGSGGYWITCIGRPILAEVGTITGSIGVFGLKPDLGALFRRVGMHEEMVALDPSAAMTSPSRGWTEAEQARMQQMVDGVYERFLALVAKSRGLTVDAVLPLAGGRVYSGDHAVELRLVDKVGGLDEALAMVRKEAGLADDVAVTHLPRPRSFMDAMVEQLVSARSLVPEGPARVLLARLGPVPAAMTVLQDVLAGGGVPRVWALTPDVTLR
ncbi:MAG TPA: signal peptide peptidase SppA [Planctomycetota bacterium]|nr:signal peptide peptidase SppA [Planctomycetota bacterium]